MNTTRLPGHARALTAVMAMALLLVGCLAPDPLVVRLEDNPHNPLSCLVSADLEGTDVELEIRVQGEGQTPFQISGWVHGTGDQVAVIGMRPQRDYTIVVLAAQEEPAVYRQSEPMTYHTGALPLDLVTELTVADEELFGGGWTLFNVSVGVGDHPPTAVMVDDEGLPVWVHQHGQYRGESDVNVSFVHGPAVLFGGDLARGTPVVEVGLDGEVLWEGPVQPGTEALVSDGGMHHWFARNQDESYTGLFYEVDGDQVDDQIRQVDNAGGTLWSWRAEPLLGGDDVPYAWGNAAHVFGSSGEAYYNSRDNSALYKIDMDGGDIVWTFGDGGDFAADPDAAEPWPTGAHGVKPIGDDHWLMYDNGDTERGYTRVVEYIIDGTAMTSTLVWQYPGELADDSWYSLAMGDADRLTDGNTLICAGNLVASAATSRVFEVTQDGSTAWSLTLRTSDPDIAAAAYMAERIAPQVTYREDGW